MNPSVHAFVSLIESNPHINTKNELIDLVGAHFAMVRDGRALYHTDFFAVVFCYSKNRTFSNVVLSLSKLEKYDHIPCFVVVVKKELDNAIYMINTTCIDKISHSSQELRVDNIKGSFLGSNIRKEFTEINARNEPADFDTIFLYHKGFTWRENIERLVEKTNHIHPHTSKAVFDAVEHQNILDSPRRAIRFVQSDNYRQLLSDLQQRCEEVKDAIFVAAHIDNVNIRGRLIEALITSNEQERRALLSDIGRIEQLLPAYDTKNDLGDYVRSFSDADSYTDIKTKILYLDSNPKAYNVDKFLKCMGKDNSVFMFFFVGIDETGIVNTILCSVYHQNLLKTTLLQQHWAGRGTRGTAQFSGQTINELITEHHFHNEIDESASKAFLQRLLDR